jgi:hypothetical protein
VDGCFETIADNPVRGIELNVLAAAKYGGNDKKETYNDRADGYNQKEEHHNIDSAIPGRFDQQLIL